MTSEKKKICIQLKTRIQWQEMGSQRYYALLLHSDSALTEPTKHFMRNKQDLNVPLPLPLPIQSNLP